MSWDDNYNRPAIQRTPLRGPGHVSLRSCWGCRKARDQAGGKKLGPLKLWHCAGCAESKAQDTKGRADA